MFTGNVFVVKIVCFGLASSYSLLPWKKSRATGKLKTPQGEAGMMIKRKMLHPSSARVK